MKEGLLKNDMYYYVGTPLTFGDVITKRSFNTYRECIGDDFQCIPKGTRFVEITPNLLPHLWWKVAGSEYYGVFSSEWANRYLKNIKDVEE